MKRVFLTFVCFASFARLLSAADLPPAPSATALKDKKVAAVWTYAQQAAQEIQTLTAQRDAAKISRADFDKALAAIDAKLSALSEVPPVATLPTPPAVEVPAKPTTPATPSTNPPEIAIISHTMAALLDGLGGSESCAETIRRAEAAQIRVHWVHCDVPLLDDVEGRKYATVFQHFFDAMIGTQSWGIPGIHGNWMTDPALRDAAADFFKRTLDHPRVFKINGVPVIAVYDFRDGSAAAVKYARAKYGKPVIVLAYVEPWFVAEVKDKAYSNIQAFLTNHDEVNGIISFAVPWTESDGRWVPMSDPRAADLMVQQGKNIIAACKATGKIAVPGFAFRYHDDIMPDADILRVQAWLTSSGAKLACVTSWNDPGESAIAGTGQLQLVQPALATFLAGKN